MSLVPSATASISSRLPLIAYRLTAGKGPEIVPAPAKRDWMNATEERFANRCLPMLIASQHGWLILNPTGFTASWTGGNSPSELVVKFDDTNGDEPWIVSSHFGHGILTWTIPYLFRTGFGYNLLVRGPTNMPKDGIAPLEGIVETDWSVATFTMNWKLTRPGAVRFIEGEPFCMIVPVRRGELASFDPLIAPIESDEDTFSGYLVWCGSRGLFNRGLQHRVSQVTSERWQKDYFNGVSPNGERAIEHETKLTLKEFVATTLGPVMDKK
jgi:hypothetical protein